ncbi:MAG TPA: hypothetical protein VKM93_28600 [Terriglobia bacterium]|nr:hypothetical protein [Terriglobia bacterium]
MLRKSPTRTEAFLAANRRNAQKCTGPRTPEGKARSSLNALKNGRYAHRLPEKLEAAGYRSAAALYGQIRQKVVTTFEAEHPADLKRADRVAALVWTMAWRGGVPGSKPQSDLFSVPSTPLSLHESPLHFRIKDHRRRIGLVYWIQRRRFWTAERQVEALQWQEALGSKEPLPVPSVGEMLEEKLRKLEFRLARPRFVERLTYRLDRDGVYDPNVPPPDPALLARHAQLYAGRWWERNDE